MTGYMKRMRNYWRGGRSRGGWGGEMAIGRRDVSTRGGVRGRGRVWEPLAIRCGAGRQ